MALSADRKLRSAYPGQGYRQDFIAAADTYYAGAIVSVAAAGGRLKVAGTTDKDVVMGVVLEHTVITTANRDTVRVPVLVGSRVWIPVASALAVVGSVGLTFSTTDDEDIAGISGSKASAGKCVDFNSDRNELLIDMSWKNTL